jgi:hypothetical protein
VRLVAIVALVGCGAAPPPIESFRDARLAHSFRLSADESLAAVIVEGEQYDGQTEVELRQRVPEQRLLAKSSGPATLIGSPSDRDALVLDKLRSLRWLRGGSSEYVDVAPDAVVIGSTTDHAAHRALVAYRRADRIIVVAYDTAKLVETSRQQESESHAESCVASGTGHALYVTCFAGADDQTELWRITRYDGTHPTWDVSVGLPPLRGPAMLASVTGDGSALVLLHGTAMTMRELFAPKRALFVDPASGTVRIHSLGSSITYADELVPVPNRPQVACQRTSYYDEESIAVIDASTAEVTIPVETLPSGPHAFAPLASGKFLVGKNP